MLGNVVVSAPYEPVPHAVEPPPAHPVEPPAEGHPGQPYVSVPHQYGGWGPDLSGGEAIVMSTIIAVVVLVIVLVMRYGRPKRG